MAAQHHLRGVLNGRTEGWGEEEVGGYDLPVGEFILLCFLCPLPYDRAGRGADPLLPPLPSPSGSALLSTVASLLKLWLLELEVPPIVYSHYDEFRHLYPKRVGQEQEQVPLKVVAEYVSRLPPVHLEVSSGAYVC